MSLCTASCKWPCIHMYNIYTIVYLSLTLVCDQTGRWYGPWYGKAIGGVGDIAQYTLQPSVVHTPHSLSPPSSSKMKHLLV